MKIVRIFLGIGLLVLAGVSSSQAGFFGFKVFDEGTSKPLVISETEAKNQQLLLVKNELNKLESDNQRQSAASAKRVAEIEKELRVVGDKKLLASGSERDFLNKKEIVLRDMEQSQQALQRSSAQLLYTLKKSVDVLESAQTKMPHSATPVDEKTTYQLSDFYALSNQYLRMQEELVAYRAEKKRYEDELGKVSQKISQTELELQQKESERKRFVVDKESKVVEVQLAGDLVDLVIKQLKLRLEVLRVRLTELQKELALVDLQVTITKSKRNLLRKELARADRKVLVSAAEITKAVADFEEQRQRHVEKIGEYSKRITELSDKRARLQKTFDHLNKKLPVPVKDVKQLTEWSLAPHTIGDEPLFYRMAWVNHSIQMLGSELLLLEAKQDFEKMRIAERELQIDALKAWGITTRRRRIADETDRKEQLAYFVEKKADIERELQSINSKDSLISNLISTQTRILAQIKQRRNELATNQKAFAHKYSNAAYQQALKALYMSQENVNRQLDINGQLIKTYSAITAVLDDMKLQAETVINKLESLGGIWQRAAGAVTWDGIKSAGTDLQFFGDDLVFIVSASHVRDVLDWLTGLATDPVAMLNLLLLTIVFAAFYFMLLLVLPWLKATLALREQHVGATFWERTAAAVVHGFYAHLIGLTIWCALLFVVRYELVVDIGLRLKIVFYLSSMVYLWYVANGFLRLLLAAWKDWLAPDFMYRLSLVLHFFVYISLALLFFKEAFLVTTYGRSELPTLIRAAQSLLIRFCLIILLMNREAVLAVLPNRGTVWSSVRAFVAHFYGLCWTLLAVLIVLSDPYVGYWHLVSTVLQGVFLSLVLLVALWFLHRFFKRYSSHLFFSSVGEGARERFSFAKTWYVLFLILSIAFLLVLAILVFSRIWGYTVSLDRLTDFFSLELVKIRGDAIGQVTSFTVRSVLVLVAFIFGGFFVTSLFNRFVLNRLFGLLEVDAGVQNTVVRISGYIIFALALSIGLHQVGLGSWVPYGITFIAVGITWAVRDPINDFFAYFILLVERSVKIGDYIRLDDADGRIGGVVRKITPRSVILRKDNSFFIVVPNSKVINAPFANWNYRQGYIAFEDILFSISYQADPVKVKEVILQVLTSNPHILKNPVPVIRINDFAQNGFEFLVRGFMSTSNVLSQWDVRSDIRFALVAEFKKNKIEFAVPMRHVRTIGQVPDAQKREDDDLPDDLL